MTDWIMCLQNDDDIGYHFPLTKLISLNAPILLLKVKEAF